MDINKIQVLTYSKKVSDELESALKILKDASEYMTIWLQDENNSYIINSNTVVNFFKE